MNPLMTVLLAMVSRPYHAVSKPTIQAWARFKAKWGRGKMFRLLASEYGAVTLGDGKKLVVPEGLRKGHR